MKTSPLQLASHDQQPNLFRQLSQAGKCWLWLLFSLPTLLGSAAPGDVDPTFDPGSTVDGTVFSFMVESDGKILIGGNFQTVHGVRRAGLARLHENGSTDQTFPSDLTGGYASAYKILPQPDGKILVAGSFTTINGLPRTNLARLEADGSVDLSFAFQPTGNAGGEVRQLVRQTDGKLIIAGSFTAVNGVSRPGLARLHVDGLLDVGFLDGLSGSANSMVHAIVLQPDGKIIIAGFFEVFNGVDRPFLARLHSDGALDSTFLNALPGPDLPVRAVALQSDGKIVIGGIFAAVNGIAQPGIARLNADGSLDESFQSAATRINGGASKIIITPDQKILISGCLAWLGRFDTSAIIRLNSDGSRDFTFDCSISVGDDVGPFELNLLADSRILLAGGNRHSIMPPYYCRLFPDGSPDVTFQNGPSGPNDDVRALALQPDGKLIIGGRFDTFNGTSPRRLTRLNPDGSLDVDYASHQSGPDREVFALALTRAGKCLVGGEFSSINGLSRPALARLNQDGSVDENFWPTFSGSFSYVYALAVQNDDKVLAGGSFHSVNGVAQTNLVRLHADGSVDSSFQPRISGGSINGVYTMALQTDGKIIIGGYFNSVGGVPRKNLARLHPHGAVDTTFLNGMAGLSAAPWSLAIQPDGKILIGGWFDTVNGATRYGLARLNPDGSLDNLFQTGLQGNSTAWAIAPQPDGKIIAGGYFYFGSGFRYLARFNPNGQLDSSFGGAQHRLNDEVHALLLQPDFKMIAAGAFTIVGEFPRSRLVRIYGDLEAPTIMAQLRSQTVEVGGTTHFRVQAEGTSPLTYLWYFNGSNYLGATTNGNWTLPEVPFDQAGSYVVIITNFGGAVTSAPAQLGVIPEVERRLVPGIRLTGEPGSQLNVEHTERLGPNSAWVPLTTVTMVSPVQWCFDLSPLPPQRFYRAWNTENPVVVAALGCNFIPALTLPGNPGDVVRVDGLNAVGPVDAWFPLDTVTMTSTSHLYFDITAPGQPTRLYRFLPSP